MSKQSQPAAAKVSPVMSTLAAYIAAARRKPLPKPVVEKAKHHILDTIAAMVSGSKLLPGVMAIRYIKTLGGTKEATVVGSRFVTNAVNAALANGMLAHADETDDSHSAALMHPGCAVVSAALAMAEREQRNGTALLRAVVLGYDVAARVCLILGGAKFSAIGHTSNSFGPGFGAAAAGAALAHCNETQVRHALSYIAQQTSGISCFARDLEHIEKAFDFGGMTARNGVSAVTMVAAGCTGVDDVFSGERNFFMAYDESKRHGIKPLPEIMARGLGTQYEIMNTSIKRWSVGSPIQAPLDCLLALIRQHHIKASDVEHVTIRCYAAGARTTNNREMPDINMQHMCALMLADGYVSFAATHNLKRMKDAKVVALRRRITLIADEELEKLRPEKHAIVEVKLRDGRSFSHRTNTVRGTPYNPMPRSEVDEKCYDLMAPVLGTRRARTLCDTIWNIEKVDNALALRPLLQV